MATETVDVVNQILRPATSEAPRYEFAFNDYLKREHRYDALGINKPKQECKAYLQGHCPLGHNCPDRHPAQGSFNRSDGCIQIYSRINVLTP